MNWTKEQEQAIYEKNSNILVAAAAGSGKTAVLVERIIHKIIDEQIDIDKILVVTFTNAAAGEMRERILDAIYKKLEEDPTNSHLQRQLTLLNKASICTIHSFCLDVIRNHFYELDISANFRIGDTAEVELLRNDAIEELFEQKYMDNDKDFMDLIEVYTDYRGDEKLQDLVLSIYNYIQSSPFPEKWLQEKTAMFNVDVNEDFLQTSWGKILLEQTQKVLQEALLKLENIHNKTAQFAELEKYTLTLSQDIYGLQSCIQQMDTWDKAYNAMQNLTWQKWPVDKKVTMDLKNEAKDIRDSVKKQIASHHITCSSAQASEDIKYMYSILQKLQRLILEFTHIFTQKKREKNIIDFHDIEHLALKLLLQEEGNKLVETPIAKEYQEKFAEIAVDEYQDSNLVQEYILNSVSNKNNIFMVGDVKQSIYKFRQARPELFLEKYEKYCLKEAKDQNETQQDLTGLKIQLFKNFRSRKHILNMTNLVFKGIMSKALGDVEYTEEEYLNYGAEYPEVPPEEEKVELHILDVKEEEDLEDELEENQEKLENNVLEAKFVANKIKQLLNSNYQVYDNKLKEYRKVTYKDICVLLRATAVMAPIYEKEIKDLDMPVFSDTSAEYLESMEVQIIVALLKVISNPMQDIPLVSVLRSSIGGFTDNDLIEIRLVDKNSSFYEAMLKARIATQGDLKEKIDNILNKLEKWKKQEEYLPLDELIWQIYTDTGFYHYVSLLTNGKLRQANLKLLFEKARQYEQASFKGLFNFINFLDKVKTSSNDLGAAKLIGENENVIRIMSIHKSKGLEFPIVYLCGLGKKFNLRDLNEPIVLDQNLGFGPKLIDSQKRIEYSTLAQEAIKTVLKRETISEEMRILYVALTRAKEKLIITGSCKDIHKNMQEKEQLIEAYKANNADKINSNLVEKYNTFLDWIELIYLYYTKEAKQLINLNIHTTKEISENIEEVTQVENSIENIRDILRQEISPKEQKNIEELLQWEYLYQDSANIPTKTSVTKMKQMEENLIDVETLMQKNKEKTQNHTLTSEPKFLEKKHTLTPMQKGTLMHLCVQKLDEKQTYSVEDLEKFIEELCMKKIITEEEKKAINVQALYNYTHSDIWEDLKKAKEIHKEQPFYINIPARKIYPKASEDENILVQGIIDLYYITANGDLVLVDYKTDKVKQDENLEEKYKIQLQIYKEALEHALGRKVNKTLIYNLR